jgi:predicted phosphodiesterase
MRIGVLSDTHDRLPTIHAALERFSQLGVKTLFHPGECCGWVTGRATAAMIDLHTNEVELIEVPT